MVLVIDVGNSNIVAGIYSGEKLIADWSLSTDSRKTSDEYGIVFKDLFHHYKLKASDIQGVIISSVVPTVMYSLEHMIRKYLNLKALIVQHGIKTGINIKYDNSRSLGADRVVNAAAGLALYKKAQIIIDFGTATTYCAITASGNHLGGAICPGIKITADVLSEKAAMLPKTELIKPSKTICKNTISSIQAGLIYGYMGQVEYIVSKMKKEMIELGEEEPLVVATGGLAKMIESESSCIDIVNPILTLEGLRILYHKNK